MLNSVKYTIQMVQRAILTYYIYRRYYLIIVVIADAGCLPGIPIICMVRTVRMGLKSMVPGIQSRQSARLFLQSSELGPPTTHRRVCPLPLFFWGETL